MAKLILAAFCLAASTVSPAAGAGPAEADKSCFALDVCGRKTSCPASDDQVQQRKNQVFRLIGALSGSALKAHAIDIELDPRWRDNPETGRRLQSICEAVRALNPPLNDRTIPAWIGRTSTVSGAIDDVSRGRTIESLLAVLGAQTHPEGRGRGDASCDSPASSLELIKRAFSGARLGSDPLGRSTAMRELHAGGFGAVSAEEGGPDGTAVGPARARRPRPSAAELQSDENRFQAAWERAFGNPDRIGVPRPRAQAPGAVGRDWLSLVTSNPRLALAQLRESFRTSGESMKTRAREAEANARYAQEGGDHWRLVPQWLRYKVEAVEDGAISFLTNWRGLGSTVSRGAHDFVQWVRSDAPSAQILRGGSVSDMLHPGPALALPPGGVQWLFAVRHPDVAVNAYLEVAPKIWGGVVEPVARSEGEMLVALEKARDHPGPFELTDAALATTGYVVNASALVMPFSPSGKAEEALTRAELERVAAMDDAARAASLKSELHLTDEQVESVLRAHNAVPCNVGECTAEQLRRKVEILQETIPDRALRRDIIERGYAGSLPSRVGKRVAVPRSHGGFTDGCITAVRPDGRVEVLFEDRPTGTLRKKILSPEALGPALPEGLFDVKAGTRVSIPRTAGGRSNAVVLRVDGDIASVQWEENGQTLRKGVKIEDLKPASASSPDLGANGIRGPPSAGFEIGSEEGPHGHKIDGGISRGRSFDREVIAVDFARDRDLTSFYDEFWRGAPGSAGEDERVEDLFQKVRGRVGLKCDKAIVAEFVNREFLIGQSLKRGAGVCRHMGILNAALLERSISEGRLGGKVYYIRGEGHGWAVYENSRGGRFVLDAAQRDRVVPMAGETYLGSGKKRYSYDDAFRESASAP